MFSLTYLSQNHEFKVVIFLLDETEHRLANLLGIFLEVVLCDIDFRGYFDVTFDLNCLGTK